MDTQTASLHSLCALCSIRLLDTGCEKYRLPLCCSGSFPLVERYLLLRQQNEVCRRTDAMAWLLLHPVFLSSLDGSTYAHWSMGTHLFRYHQGIPREEYMERVGTHSCKCSPRFHHLHWLLDVLCEISRLLVLADMECFGDDVRNLGNTQHQKQYRQSRSRSYLGHCFLSSPWRMGSHRSVMDDSPALGG